VQLFINKRSKQRKFILRGQMMNPIKISVFNLVGNGFCTDAKDGEVVFNAISKAIQQEQPVEISFQNVDMLTSAFLNPAIGQLYRDFTEEKVRELVRVTEIDDVDIALLRRVIDTAKLYYKEPSWLEESVKKIMGDYE
jgi:Icc-related predicted phosphoesterase